MNKSYQEAQAHTFTVGDATLWEMCFLLEQIGKNNWGLERGEFKGDLTVNFPEGEMVTVLAPPDEYEPSLQTLQELIKLIKGKRSPALIPQTEEA